jgi:hypothetical protein
MHALTLASDQGLRDDLFLACAGLQSSDVLLFFASISEISSETALSPIWLRAPASAAIAKQPPLLPGKPMVMRTPLAKHELAMLPLVWLKN